MYLLTLLTTLLALALGAHSAAIPSADDVHTVAQHCGFSYYVAKGASVPPTKQLLNKGFFCYDNRANRANVRCGLCVFYK
jgi:hypothetical protein